MIRKNLYLAAVFVCFSYTMPLYATDNAVILGGTSSHLLRIEINPGGTYGIYRYINNTWQQQLYSPSSHLFFHKNRLHYFFIRQNASRYFNHSPYGI